jgi:PAP2 superfamily
MRLPAVWRAVRGVQCPVPAASHANAYVLVARSADPSFHERPFGRCGCGRRGAVFREHATWNHHNRLALFMAFARVYVGAHYPGDVLAGLAFGALIACAGVPVADRVGTPVVQWLLDTPVGRRFAGSTHV